jgi:hypothetical protein
MDEYYTYYDNNNLQSHVTKWQHYEDVKYYDICGNITSHDICNGVFILCATYRNNKLETYYMQMVGFITLPYNIIERHPHEPFFINLLIIHPIRSVQKRFKKRMYSVIFNELNQVIYVNDISKLIISYIKN